MYQALKESLLSRIPEEDKGSAKSTKVSVRETKWRGVAKEKQREYQKGVAWQQESPSSTVNLVR